MGIARTFFPSPSPSFPLPPINRCVEQTLCAIAKAKGGKCHHVSFWFCLKYFNPRGATCVSFCFPLKYSLLSCLQFKGGGKKVFHSGPQAECGPLRVPGLRGLPGHSHAPEDPPHVAGLSEPGEGENAAFSHPGGPQTNKNPPQLFIY